MRLTFGNQPPKVFFSTASKILGKGGKKAGKNIKSACRNFAKSVSQGVSYRARTTGGQAKGNVKHKPHKDMPKQAHPIVISLEGLENLKQCWANTVSDENLKNEERYGAALDFFSKNHDLILEQCKGQHGQMSALMAKSSDFISGFAALDLLKRCEEKGHVDPTDQQAFKELVCLTRTALNPGQKDKVEASFSLPGTPQEMALFIRDEYFAKEDDSTSFIEYGQPMDSPKLNLTPRIEILDTKPPSFEVLFDAFQAGTVKMFRDFSYNFPKNLGS